VGAPKLRVFAGPNGSGKSTIKDQIPARLVNLYVNADELEKSAKTTGFIDLSDYGLELTEQALRMYLTQHPLIIRAGLQESTGQLTLSGQKIDLRGVDINSYHAAVIADLIRHQLLERGISFTFETVMSSSEKVRFMEMAQQMGYRTYLYFVATDSPQINILRVANRVDDGGHDVPIDKIIQRYARTLSLLPEAISAANRAYIFDNSGDESVFLAEITDGTTLEFHQDDMPDWFINAYLSRVWES
jgi:predicted ABC-type ATPase